MRVDGGSSFQAIEPYLNEPTEDVVDEAFGRLVWYDRVHEDTAGPDLC